jgi:hypothetical protein
MLTFFFLRRVSGRIAIASVAEPRDRLVRAHHASSRPVASFRASPRALPDDASFRAKSR